MISRENMRSTSELEGLSSSAALERWQLYPVSQDPLEAPGFHETQWPPIEGLGIRL